IMVDNSAAALERGEQTIARSIARREASGRIDADAAERLRARIETAQNLSALAQCDLIIEAVIEDIEVKREVFEALDAVAKPHALLATNTSYLDIDSLADAT